jgi:7,8-dihydropterin-6-yl-methyl-4-(beta-D-ribofuranosyl)aminobenzene 5'-phosphate synthase
MITKGKSTSSRTMAKAQIQIIEVLCAIFFAMIFGVWSAFCSNCFDNGRKGPLVLEKMGRPAKPSLKQLSLAVVYDNNPYKPSLETAWGFSCVIKGGEKTILFDTGADGAMLLRNMRKVGIDPLKIDVIVLSHIHSDHVGGLTGFLRKNQDVTVYLPKSFPEDFKNEVKSQGGIVIEISGPTEICNGVYSTGELGSGLKEQSLVIVTDNGSIVITGCAHPGIVRIVAKAREMNSSAVRLLLGGFHLLGETRNSIEKTISRLKALHVEHVGPCHCSGDLARKLFRMAWGQNYLDVGVGRVISMRDLE